MSDSQRMPRLVAVYNDHNLSVHEKAFLGYLLARIRKVGQRRWDSNGTLAVQTSCSVSKIKLVKASLQRKGWLKVTPNFLPSGRQSSDFLDVTGPDEGGYDVTPQNDEGGHTVTGGGSHGDRGGVTAWPQRDRVKGETEGFMHSAPSGGEESQTSIHDAMCAIFSQKDAKTITAMRAAARTIVQSGQIKGWLKFKQKVLDKGADGNLPFKLSSLLTEIRRLQDDQTRIPDPDEKAPDPIGPACGNLANLFPALAPAGGGRHSFRPIIRPGEHTELSSVGGPGLLAERPSGQDVG